MTYPPYAIDKISTYPKDDPYKEMVHPMDYCRLKDAMGGIYMIEEQMVAPQ